MSTSVAMAVVLILGTSVASCGPPACGTGNCTGCCTTDGVCEDGATLEYCGSGGATCASCTSGQSCDTGACVAAMTGCGVGNCPHGCCAGDVCRTGTETAACGSGGGACVACATTEACGASGVCVAPSTGCATSCAGCCTGNQCSAGNTTTACGISGNACAVCGAGEVCDQGACKGACGASTCPSGCCAGTTCIDPPTNNQCGTDGAACSACGGGQVCTASGQCKLDLAGVCTRASDCASSVCVFDAGSTTQGACRTGCTPPATCSADFNCVPLDTVGGACLPAPTPTSLWKVAILSAMISQTDSSGSAWDAFGGAPDPYVCIAVDGATQECTPYVSDSFAPDYAFVSSGTYSDAALANVTITVYDDDVTSDDLIDTFTNRDLRSQAAGRSWDLAFTGTYALQVAVEVRPQ